MSIETIIAIIIWLLFIVIARYKKKIKKVKQNKDNPVNLDTYDFKKLRKILKESWDNDGKSVLQAKEPTTGEILTKKENAYFESSNNENKSEIEEKEKKRNYNLKKWVVYDAVFNKPKSKTHWKNYN